MTPNKNFLTFTLKNGCERHKPFTHTPPLQPFHRFYTVIQMAARAAVIDLTGGDAPRPAHACHLCNVTFSSSSALKKHTQRKNACISYQEADARITNLTTELSDLRAKYYELAQKYTELSILYDKEVAEFKAKLQALQADLFLKEEMAKPAFTWQSISIVAPFLSDNNKKTIKKAIKDMSSTDDIRAYLTATFPNARITRLVTRNKNKDLEILLQEEEAVECKICFENKAQPKGRCATCTHCQICLPCESDLIRKNKPCPFCTSPFLSIRAK